MWTALPIWLILGIVGNFGPAVLGPLYYKIHWKVIVLVWALHQPAGSLFYITGILSLLARWPQWIPKLAPLGAVGRMALTNYLVQSMTGTFLYYGYGFGLQTKLGNLAGLLLCVVVFVVQIFYSHWWLKRFQFGPFEWFWRLLTYGRVPSMRFGQTARA